MAWFRKKPDPISDRARSLSDEIAKLESQIKELDAQVQRDQSQPRLRSPALPQGSTVGHATPAPAAPPARAHHEPIFEEVGHDVLEGRGEAGTIPEHYNELGVRKYDLLALLRRFRGHFRGPSTTNPKLVSYLAAGGIQGLRPLRYEKRVARNRFIFFVVILFLALLGTLLVFLKGHR
jgi:cell division protein FtsB